MRYLVYFSLFCVSCMWAYSFKPVEAQAQKSRPVRGSIGSVMTMNSLTMIAPTKDSALVSVNQAYFVNNQWYSAIFMYVKSDTRPANGSRIYLNVTGKTGAWNVYKFGLDYSDVFGLQSILTGLLNRATADSSALISEVTRAKAAEAQLQPKGAYLASETDPSYTANGATRSYANSLSARQVADSIRLLNEVSRATTAEASKLSASDAAATYQLKGTYLTTETDPLSVPKTRTINGYPLTANVTLGKSDVGLGNVDNTADVNKPVSSATLAAISSISTRVAADSLRDVNKVQTVTAGVNAGIAIAGTTQNPTVSRTIASYNNAPARVVGTSYQLSTTRPTRVSYTVSVTTTISLLNLNSSGVVYLEISANNSTWTTVNSAGITRTLAVSISVGVNDTSLFNVQCEVPVGYYVRLRSVVSGGGSVSFMSGQEVID